MIPSTAGWPALAADCLAIGLFDDSQLTDAARQLDTASKGQLRRLRDSGDLPSRLGDTQLLLQLPGVRARPRAGDRPRQARGFQPSRLAQMRRSRAGGLHQGPVRASGAGDRTPGCQPSWTTTTWAAAVADLAGAALYRVNDLKSGRRPAAAGPAARQPGR